MQHATKYLKENPPNFYRKTIMDDKDITMFAWSVAFHNNVNKRLGKRIMGLKEAYTLYTSDSPCMEKDCGSKDEQDTSQDIPYGIQKSGLERIFGTRGNFRPMD